MRKHERRKITESIVDGEKDKHMEHREHQTGMDTGVKGDKGCIKLLWTRCTYVGITCTQLLSLGRVNDRKHKQKIQDSSTVMLIIHKFTFLLKYKHAGRKSSSSPVVIN